GEQCRRGARKRRTDAWLNDRVSANYVTTIWRKLRLIQRMRESFDHPPGSVAQQLGIGIQGDDEANALELRTIARIEKPFQLGRGFADKKSIEFLKLAALALPADPALLALAPHAAAMEKKEVPRSVSAIQFLDAAGHDVDILCVLWHTLPRCVRKICQERKTQIRIRVSEIMDFKPVELALDRAWGGQQHRHSHERV